MRILQTIAGSCKIVAPVGIVIMLVWLMVSCVILFSSVRADGTVVQSVERGSGDDLVYCPVFIFRDSSGFEHTNRATGGSNPPRFPVGSKVSVLYRTSNPDAAQIDDSFMLWICPLIFIALFGFYGTVGILIGRWLQKKGTRNAA